MLVKKALAQSTAVIPALKLKILYIYMYWSSQFQGGPLIYINEQRLDLYPTNQPTNHTGLHNFTKIDNWESSHRQTSFNKIESPDLPPPLS